MNSRKAMDALAVAMMLVICLILSLQQIGLKAAAPDMAPILQVALRSGIGALLIGIFMLLRKEKLTLLYQLMGAFVLLLSAAFAFGQLSFNPTPLAIGNLIFQSVIVSFASFLAWFWLLRRYLASRLGVFSFMTPIFGILFGAILLNEKIEFNFFIGAILVMTGIAIVSGHGWIKQLLLSQKQEAT